MRVRLALPEDIGGHADRLGVHEPVEQCAAPRDSRLTMTTWPPGRSTRCASQKKATGYSK